MTDYTYNQLVKMDMTFGGLTKRQSVLSRTLDRRWKKAYNNIMVKKQKAKCRMEERVFADLCCYYDDQMGG